MIQGTSLLFVPATLRPGNTSRTEKLGQMLKSKEVSEIIGCTIRKCRANEGASLIDPVGVENGRVKHSRGAFHPTAKWSCGLTSPAL